MWGRRRIARAAVIGGVALAAVVGPTATPAKADCLYLDFWILVEDTDGDGHDEPEYVHLGCVTNTSYPWVLGPKTSGKQEGLPPGTPMGYYLHAEIPLPG